MCVCVCPAADWKTSFNNRKLQAETHSSRLIILVKHCGEKTFSVELRGTFADTVDVRRQSTSRVLPVVENRLSFTDVCMRPAAPLVYSLLNHKHNGSVIYAPMNEEIKELFSR